MKRDHVTIAYCLDNSPVVDELEGKLSTAPIEFTHFSGNHELEAPTLSEKLAEVNEPIILIVSDNFLKSAQCMGKGIELLQQHNKQLLPIVVDGVERDAVTGELVYTVTNFDRVSDIIKYINFWQDQYLDLRRKKRQIDNIDETTFNARLKKLRDISSEVGEFLRLLRSMNYLSMEQLEDNSFESLFRFLDNIEGWEIFKSNLASPVVEEVPETTSSEPTVTDVEESTPPVGEAPTPGDSTGDLTEENVVVLDPLPEEENASQTLIEKIFEPVPEAGEGNSDPNPGESLVETAEQIEVEAESPEKEVIAPQPEEQEDNTLALVKEALNYFDHGRIEEALQIMAQAVANNPQDPELRYHYALMLAKDNRDLVSAKTELEAVVSMEPMNAEAFALLGKVAEQLDAVEEAKNAYEKVVEINPNYQGVYFKLGTLVLNHFDGQQELAATYFMEAFRHNSKNANAAYLYAKLLSDQFDNKPKALDYFKKVVEVDPTYAEAYFEMAKIYKSQGEDAEARLNFELAAQQDSAFDTAENQIQFAIPTVEEEPTPVDETTADEKAESVPLSEENTIEALKNNIYLLEELLKAKKEKQQPLVVEAEAPTPEIKNTTVLVTGATAGIGRATARIFAEHNYRLILNGRRADRLEDLKTELEEAFVTEVHILPFDVRDVDAMQMAFESLPENWKKIDILINNAGKAKGLDPIHEGSLEHWEEMIDTNIKGLLYMTRLVTPQMVERQSGHIINVSSTAGKEVYPKGNVYCATKHAVEALTKAMRIDLHQHNVKVSQVSPGMVEETEFAVVRFDGDEEKAKIYNDFNPLKSSDVAESIFFIATRPSHVNVQDVLMMGTQQANSVFVDRSGRNHDEA